MSPDGFNQQPQGAANLPSMPVQSVQAVPAAPVPAPAAPAPVGAEPPMDVTVQAEQLAARYAQDPYQLAESFGQLKTAYLLHAYHITTNPAGS